MPFLPCRHPFECGRWFDISWSKPLSTRRTRLFDRNRGESSPFHSSRHPDNLPLTFLPNFSSFSLSLSFFPLFSFPSFSLFPFHIDSRKIWINSRKYDQNLSSFSSTLVSQISSENLDKRLFKKYLHLRLRLFLLPSSILASSRQKFE